MLTDRRAIEEWLTQIGITNYTIYGTFRVNVYGNVNLSGRGLGQLPIQFGVVTGSFDCSYSELISLKGAPLYVSGTFNCSYNSLTSLEGAPLYVGGDFLCTHNRFTSLKGAPSYVGGEFVYNSQALRTLEEAPPYVIESILNPR